MSRILNEFSVEISSKQCHLVEVFQIHPYVNFVRHPCILIWESPPAEWVKLNIDGSCSGNPGSCGGGVICDNRGNFMAAFSKRFRDGTNNGTKLQALISGLRFCQELGLVNVCLESDSELVVG